jgi:hypothetical protein
VTALSAWFSKGNLIFAPVTILNLKRLIPYTVKKETTVMRKGTLFISAALTTFMLAVMFGVASAYQNIFKSTQQVAVQAQPTAVEVINAPIVSAPPTQAMNITPETAATFASKIINRTDLFSAEITKLNGADAYLVTFSSGDLVYVSLDGQILSISKLPVKTIVQKGSKRGASDNQRSNPVASSAGGGSASGGEHEGGDD